MKKIVCILLTFSLISSQITSTYADSLPLGTRVDTITETVKDSQQMDYPLINISKESVDKKEPLVNNSDQPVMPNELVEKISDEVEKYNPDDSDPNWKPSKLQMAKNMAICLAKNFVNDVKAYIKFYPLMKVAQLISYCGCLLPLYALYKKTGIDVPAKISNFMMGHENLAILGRNLYNVIPMTLASFLFKWGSEACSYMKN